MVLRLIFALILSLSTSPAFAAKKCVDGGKWVETNGSLMMGLRSNACHFWKWAAANAGAYLPKEILDENGWVAGDAHHENFSHVFIGGKRTYVLDDLDDSGFGPLFLDFLKFWGVSKSVSEKGLSTETALNAYISGLRGEKWASGTPQMLKEDAGVTQAQLKDDYLKKIKKKTSDGEFEAADGLIKWSQMSADQKKQFQDLEDRYFKKVIPTRYKIKDRAFFTKEGRENVVRAWYYLKNGDDDRQILEFKEMDESALNGYQTQPGSEFDRKSKVLQAYWGSDIPQLFGVIGDTSHAFWMRLKLPAYIDFNKSSFRDDLPGFAELTYFISFKLGEWHALQLKTGKYSQNLSQNFKNLTAITDRFTSDYLDRARAQHKGGK